MSLKRPNKALLQDMRQNIKNLQCPIHAKTADITMDSENEPVDVKACCIFFQKDILQICERMRKDFLYKAEKTRERIERERRRMNDENPLS